MIDVFNFGTLAGNLALDCRAAKIFKGALSGNLAISFDNLGEGESVLVRVFTGSSSLSFTSVNFLSGITFPTTTTVVVRITMIGTTLCGELVASY